MTVMHKDLTGGNLHILFRTGTADDRELVTPRPGDGWLETDTGKIFVCYVAGIWNQQSQVDGDLKAKFTDIEDSVNKTHEHNEPMLGMQWKEVIASTDVGAWLCAVFIPEAHRWLFGSGIYNEEIKDYEGAVLYSDNLVNFKVAKTFTDSDQVKSLLVVRFIDEDGNRVVRIIAGAGKGISQETFHPARIWTSDDYGITWTCKANLAELGEDEDGTKGTNAATELLELNDGTVLAFTRGDAYKVFKSANHGEDWVAYTTLQGTQQIFAADYDPEHNVVGMGAIGGTQRGFHYSTDGCYTIQTGYLTDGNGGRVNKTGVHAVCYDPVNKKWFFGTPGDGAHGYLFRADYTDLETWTEVKQFGGLPASEDQASVLKLHYVKPWGRMFILTCCAEAFEGLSDYTEVWSTTDGGCAVAGDMKIYREWDSYVPRRLLTYYGSGKRRSIRELCAHVYGDGKFVFGAAESTETGVRLFVKTNYVKPILSYYAQDFYTEAGPPERRKCGYLPVLRFDDGGAVADEKAWIKGFSLSKFDLSKPIRIRLEYCMAADKGEAPATAYIRVELAWIIVHRDEDLSPGPITGSSAKSIQVSDTKHIFEQYDEFYIPEDSARFPSDICALRVMRDSDYSNGDEDDLRNGDWSLFALHLFQDV